MKGFPRSRKSVVLSSHSQRNRVSAVCDNRLNCTNAIMLCIVLSLILAAETLCFSHARTCLTHEYLKVSHCSCKTDIPKSEA